MVKVAFVQKTFYSYFGTMSISAVLKKNGHETELFMEFHEKDIVDAIKNSKPDVVAFSCLTATGEFEWAVETAKKLKRILPDVPIVFGSIHPTLFPEKTINENDVDIICVGEGEIPMLELCNKLGKKPGIANIPTNIPGLWVKKNGKVYKNGVGELVEDLDSLPFADRALYDKYHYFDNATSIDALAGRNCPFNCSFCYSHVFREMYKGKGKFVRKRSVANVIEELEEVKEKYSPKFFTFVDELFTLEKTWLYDFLAQYKEKINIPFICSVRLDLLTDEMVLNLKNAGCYRVCVGLETGSEELRNGILRKNIPNAKLIESAKLLKKHKLKFLTTNMLGLPGETLEQGFETVKLNQQIGTDFVWCSVFQPYPLLDITKDMIEKKIIPDADPSCFPTTYFTRSLLKQKDIEKLVNLHKFFYISVKFPFTTPIIKQLIKLPSNKLFDWVFILSFGYFQMSYYHRSPLQVLRMGLSNLKIFSEK